MPLKPSFFSKKPSFSFDLQVHTQKVSNMTIYEYPLETYMSNFAYKYSAILVLATTTILLTGQISYWVLRLWLDSQSKNPMEKLQSFLMTIAVYVGLTAIFVACWRFLTLHQHEINAVVDVSSQGSRRIYPQNPSMNVVDNDYANELAQMNESQNISLDDLPKDLCCPISHLIPVHPVCVIDRFTGQRMGNVVYDLENLHEWLAIQRKLPIPRVPFSNYRYAITDDRAAAINIDIYMLQKVLQYPPANHEHEEEMSTTQHLHHP